MITSVYYFVKFKIINISKNIKRANMIYVQKRHHLKFSPINIRCSEVDPEQTSVLVFIQPQICKNFNSTRILFCKLYFHQYQMRKSFCRTNLQMYVCIKWLVQLFPSQVFKIDNKFLQRPLNCQIPYFCNNGIHQVFVGN